MEYTTTELIAMLRESYQGKMGDRLSDPKNVAALFADTIPLSHEEFWCVGLDSAHRIIYKEMISKGSLDRTVVHPREVFKKAIMRSAQAIIVGHNHPSGNTTPSSEDDDLTERLGKCASLLGIPLLDHVVIGAEGYYSYLEHGNI